MAKLTLTDITSGYNLAGAYNANNALIEAALENTLSRDGTNPNEMEAPLSMGGFRLTNLGEPTNDNDAVRLVDVATIVSGGDINISPTVTWSAGITGIPSRISDIAGFTDTGSDTIVFWDTSTNTMAQLTVGSGLSISGTTLSATGASVAWTSITSVPTVLDTFSDLTDPGADRLVFWDDSVTGTAFLTVSTGLAISATNLVLSHLGFENLSDPGADRIVFWDDTGGTLQWLTIGTGLDLTGTTLSLGTGLEDFAALVDPNADRLIFWDDSAGAHVYLTLGDHLTITDTTLDVQSTTGTFTGTLTGVNTVVTAEIKYCITGSSVVLYIPDITGTSNSTAHTITGAPAALFPTQAQPCIGTTTNNSVDALGIIRVETTGVLTLLNVLSTTFAGTGTEGAKASVITYLLN